MGRKLTVVSVGAEVDAGADIDVVRERHPVGVDHALGPPGRSRRVEQIPDRPGRPARARRRMARRRGQRRLIIAVEIDRRQSPGERGGGARLAGAVEEQSRLGIGDQPVQLGGRHPPVERHQDRAQPGAAEQQLEEFDPVAGEHRDPVALADPARGEQGGGPRGPRCRARHRSGSARSPHPRARPSPGVSAARLASRSGRSPIISAAGLRRPDRWRGRRPRPGPCPRPRCRSACRGRRSSRSAPRRAARPAPRRSRRARRAAARPWR